MLQLPIVLLSAMLALAGAVDAQEPTRVRGAISTFAGNVVSVKSSDGRVVDIQVGEKTEILFAQPMKITEIKAGDFLAITSDKRDDGSLQAFEIRRLPKPVLPGHRPFGGRSDQTMTNATVSAVVQSSKGRELTVTYEGGSQKIIVPEKASISMLVPGDTSHLKSTATVFLVAMPADGGKLIAQRIQVSPPI